MNHLCRNLRDPIDLMRPKCEVGLAALTVSTKLVYLASFDYGIEIVNAIDFLLHR